MRKPIIAGLASVLLVSACATETGSNRRLYGAGIGAATGAALGTLAGGDDKRNAAIGAVVGGIAGVAVGDYMDKQEAALRKATAGTDIDVVRNGDQIQLVAPSDVTFAVSSATINPGFYKVLNDVSATLKAYPSTAIDIIGHASTDGPADYNQRLSEQRALSVQNYLGGQGVEGVRMKSYGLGESNPLPGIAGTNPANRRVELILTPVVDSAA